MSAVHFEMSDSHKSVIGTDNHPSDNANYEVRVFPTAHVHIISQPFQGLRVLADLLAGNRALVVGVVELPLEHVVEFAPTLL